MIRHLLAALMLAALPAHGKTAAEVVARFHQVSALERAEDAYTLCEGSLKRWPEEVYRQQIEALGDLWAADPEAAYYSLSLCQSLWQTKYLQPVRLKEIEDKHRQARLALLISMADVINLPGYLREEIRLYITAVAGGDARIPPAPFEILSGMAATERQMDTLLMEQVRETGRNFAAGLTGIGGTAVALARGAKAVTEFTAVTSKTVGTVAKQALLITALSTAAGAAADYAIWRSQHSDLYGQLQAILQKMETPGAPVGLYLDQLAKAVEQLGYFYNIELYLRDSGSATPSQIINSKCLASVRAAADQPLSLVRPLVKGRLCRDATALAIAVSQFLSYRWPEQAQARALASKLMARAKRTLLSQADIDAYWAAQPVCQPIFHPEMLFRPVFRCYDPKSGSEII